MVLCGLDMQQYAMHNATIQKTTFFELGVDSKKNVNGTGSGFGVVVVYRTRMLAVTGSKRGNSFLLFLAFLFLYIVIVSSFRVILVWS